MEIKMKKCIILLLFLCVVIKGNPNEGSVRGRITDQKTARALPGVNIVVMGTDYGAMSDEQGYYRITNIPPGSYVFRFSMIGYADISKINVEVHPGNETNLNVELVAEAVLLSAVTVTAPAFEKSKGAVVSERTIDLGEIRTDPASQGDI